MEAEERALLAATVDGVVAAAANREAATIDTALSELGWLEMLGAEPRTAVGVVFEALGRHGAPPTVLDDVVVVALGLDASPARAVLLSQGGDVRISTARLASATELVVVDADAARLVPVDQVDATPVRGIDPEGRWSTVRGTSSGTDLGPVDWTAAEAAGRRACAHTVAGACRTMLRFAVEHARSREQFGRPVAQFQAVRHRLAEALVAIEALDAVLISAWDEPGPLTAMLSKAWAGQTAAVVRDHCQQVLAGIGFTTDHAFHRYLKRTLILDVVLGTTEDLTAAIGTELLALGTAPTLVEL